MSDDSSKQVTDQETPILNDGGTSLLNRVFGALANRRRRYILYYLREHDHAATDDLAVQLGAWETEVSRDEVPLEVVEEIKMSLVHTHLAKLEDFGLVEYDQRSETVRYTPSPRFLEAVLELSASLENPP